LTEFIQQFFSSVFHENVVLCTILIAMVPIIELKGAIPFSMSVSIWGANALNLWQGLVFGIIGSSIIIPILALLYKPLINFLKSKRFFKKLGEKIENKISKKKNNIEEKISQNNYEQGVSNTKNLNQKSNNIIKIFFVLLFVAIPLPFTGVWTGTCLAVALGFNFFATCAMVLTGNIIAGLIVTIVSSLLGASSLILVYILFGVILLFLLLKLIIGFCSKNNKISK